jgi:hypothetical protein
VALRSDQIERFARQLILAPIGGAGQERILAARILLCGAAPLCERYLRGAGVGSIVAAGSADLVLDLEEGVAFRRAAGARLWGGVVEGRVRLGCDPVPASGGTPAERAVLEVLAAGEALWRLLGHAPHVYDFAV